MSSIHLRSCVGPPIPVREFAIRDRVSECLDRLNIRSERIMVDDGTIARGSGTPLQATQIKVDRTSLVARLRDWLRDDDVKISLAAMEAVKDIRGEDVAQMIDDLRSDGTLAPEKLRDLRDLKRSP